MAPAEIEDMRKEDGTLLFRLLFVAALATASLTFWPTTGVVASTSMVAQALPPVFNTESEAQAHCPRDVVVWLNIPTGIYHYKGERWYGRTKHGAYACEKEAIKAGDRASENGQ
jgi:hypothetical protein